MELSPTDQSLVDALRQPVCLGGYDGFAPDPLHVQAADRIVELLSQLGTEKTMHAAWRKRAEEAEAENLRLTEQVSSLLDTASAYKASAISAVVLPEGARVFVKSGTDKGSYVTMIDGKPYIEWHPPKAESGEGDEYAKDPDAGTLASELCRIADSIGRNDCTRKWAEKFIYSIVDELPPAIASHVMRPPVESAPAPKAPAASEEPKPVQRGMNCACLSGEHEHCTCGYEWRVKLQTEQTMHAAWRKRAEEAEDERDEILERLKEIGDLVGCNHFNDPDGRLKLVNCVQDCLMSAESIAYVRRLTNQRNYSDPPVAKRPDGFPRRNDVSLYCPAEAAIKAAVDAVEATGADVLLTDAVVLLGLAKDKVADFVELPR